MAIKWIEDIGSTLGRIKLGLTGVVLKNNSGNLVVRNSADTADAEITIAKVNTQSIDVAGNASLNALITAVIANGVGNFITVKSGPTLGSTALTATAPLNFNSGTTTLSIPQATSSVNGFLSSADWTTFNNKMSTTPPSLTVTGTAGSGFVGLNTQTSAPSTPSDGVRLHANASGWLTWKDAAGISFTFGATGGSVAPRIYTLPTTSCTIAALESLSATAPLSYNNATGAFSITQASASTSGFISASDWVNFTNNKHRSFPFTYQSGATLALFTIPAGSTVYAIRLFITTPFDGSTATALRVGDATVNDRLMLATSNNPATVAEYESDPVYTYASATAINLSIALGTGVTQGAGFIVVES